MMGSWIGITLIEVGGASACSGLEAEGKESFASCLRSFVPQDKLSDPKACPVEWRKAYSTGERSHSKSNAFSFLIPNIDNLVKSQKWDGKVKSPKCKACES